MKCKHEGLEIWQIAVELIKVVNKILKKYHNQEKYVLVTHGAIS